jgi:glycine reductase complex component B subunit alpha and beta
MEGREMPDRITLPPFELATYTANDVLEGSPSRWDAGRLHIDVAALGSSAADPALAEIHLDVVRPGDAVRVANVLDAVLPDVKVADRGMTFPGALGTLTPSGHGRTNRVGGLSVLSVCDWLAAGYSTEDEFPDSLVDMDGPGAGITRWGSTIDVVVRCVPAEGAPIGDVDRAVRRASLRIARDIAATTIDREPDSVESFDAPAADTDAGLPGVCVILQVASEGPLTDTFLYGRAVGGIDPTVLDPLELLDGALTNGAYDWPAVRNLTATYQDSSLVRTLLAGHGEQLRFAGLILALGYLDSSFEKRRSAMLSARLARWLGADGAICTTFSSGNSHTDTMLTVRACESLGIRTTAIVSETNGGLTDHVAEADSIVSVGNEDQLVEPWTPDRVIGADELVRAGQPVPTWAYLGACVQTGDMSLTAVPA